MKEWFLLDTAQTLKRLDTKLGGLEVGEVDRRRAKYGSNELPFDAVRKRMTTVHQIPGDGQSIHPLVTAALQFAGGCGSGSQLGLLPISV